MLKSFISTAILLCASLGAIAQTTREEVGNDINKAGGVYYAYPVSESVNTPPPAGYKPFYISHYGRHGSRYQLSDDRYRSLVKWFSKADSLNLLTPLGKDVLEKSRIVLEEARDRGGDLSPLGVRQHRGIAERMYRAYPEVFADSTKMTARSTTVVRCVLSMDAFCERLKELNPSLQINRDAAQKYMRYLSYRTPKASQLKNRKDWKKRESVYHDSLITTDRVMSLLFTNPSMVAEKIAKPKKIVRALFVTAAGMQDLESPVRFDNIFSPQEIFDQWQISNASMYRGNGNYPEANGEMIKSASNLVRNFIETADEAIKAGTPTATLRFGHDTNIVPFVALMHFENCDLQEADPDKFYQAFANFKIVPMAANIQLVFFRNESDPKAPVLVKFMLNERETRIPVKTGSWPFYKWDDVKNYYLNEVLAD